MQLDRKEGQKKELVATVVQLKRTKSRKTLFSSSGKEKHIMFFLVIATGSRSSTLQYGRLFKWSKRNENQSIKFSSERTRWSSMSPWKKKNTSVIKNIALMLLQKRSINFKMIIRALGCLNLTGGCHFSNLRHVCGDSFHALQSLGVSGVEMKIYERSLQSPFLGPSLVRSCEARPNRRACSQATGRVTRWPCL